VGSNTIKTYASFIKSFYKAFAEPLSSIAALPPSISRDKGKIENRAFEYRPKDVRRLLSVMRSNKDKAITLLLFQSGADLLTIFSMKYGDVQHAIEEDKSPVVVRVKRQKTNVEYKMCFGRNALDALKIFIREWTNVRSKCHHCGASWKVKRRICPKCKEKGITNHQIERYNESLNYDSLLFAADEKGIETSKTNFDERFREYAVVSQIVTQAQLDRADMNPGRPYALRSAFRTILELNGMQESFAEFLMGHKDKYKGAYRNMTDDELRGKYKEFEKYLSITDIIELQDVQKELREELKKRDYIIAGMEARLKEVEEREKRRAENLGGGDSEATLQTVLRVFEALDSDPELLQELKNELMKKP